MADITHIMGGAWTPPTERPPDPADVQFIDHMLALGIEPPEALLLDGKLHRFRTGSGAGKSFDKTGWYVGYSDGIPTITFGDWRTGIESTYKADIGRKYTVAEEMAAVQRMQQAKAARDLEIQKKHEVAASTVETIWQNGTDASPDHPYLKRKNVHPHGARVTGDGRLMLPLFGDDGELASIQYIDESGGKLYHPGGATGGKFWMIGTLDEHGTLYIAEGFATGATIHEATGRPCLVAYSASNLVPVTKTARDMYGAAQDIVIVADHDSSGVGQRYAEQASAKYGARMVMPPEMGDANDYAAAGHDLKLLLEPPANDWLIPADDFCAQPSPIAWMVKHWIQRNALIMVHGPSGGGKTFCVLDWCLRIAHSREETWHGNKVRSGSVVYLAGEGHHGLRGRIAAWKHHHSAGALNMWLSRDGCDLNTAAGYLRVVDSIRALKTTPEIIVVDTLHRFLLGDENSAQDAKTMLDACNALMMEFNCSVILVHHTGVSDEAQHRARGSSAWRGALDIEISVVPGKDDAPMKIVQRKSKDAELAQDVYCELQQVAIPNWLDEDGNQVTSAVLIEANAPAEVKKDSKTQTHIRTLEATWDDTGREKRDGKPYISRSGLLSYLTEKVGMSEATARKYIQPSAVGKPISELINAGIIEAFEHGWIVVEETQISAMMILK
jgi:phage/plasmid primase-like uncharacterized protein